MTEINEYGNSTPLTKSDADSKPGKASPGSNARSVATQRLIEAHRDEFENMYEEEAKKVGAKTARMKKNERIERLRKELADLGVDEAAHPDRPLE